MTNNSDDTKNTAKLSTLPMISSLVMYNFPQRLSNFRELTVMEAGDNKNIQLPFAPQRIFTVRSKSDCEKGGGHAHYHCRQILLPLMGQIEITCRGVASPMSNPQKIAEKKFIFSGHNQALLIPPGIWAEQFYPKCGDLLLVLCDMTYDESDYIRSWQNYVDLVSNFNTN